MSDQIIEKYRPNVRVKPRTFSITPSDFDSVKWIAGYLQCSNSEAVRSAIRAYALHCAELEQLKTR